MVRILVLFTVLLTPFSVQAIELELDHLAESWSPVIGVSIASKHIGADEDFQEFNPGVSIGARRDIGWRGGEWGLEAGVFQNSYDERSFYAGAWADWPIADLTERTQLRFGGFFAYAEYPQLVDEAEDFGAFVIGDFIPLVAAQAAVRFDDHFALVTRFGPGIEDSDVILSLQAMYLF